MSAQKLSGEGKLRWTEEHRRALHLLKTEFVFDSDQEVELFSHVFNVEGTTKGKLCSQYWEKTREGKEHQWSFAQDDTSAERRCRKLMKERIYQAAKELDIEELDDGRLQRLSLSTPGGRKKRSRSSPPLGSAARDITEDEQTLHPKRRRGIPTVADVESDSHENMGVTEAAFGPLDATPTEAQPAVDLNTAPDTPRTPKRKPSARELKATIVYDRPLGPVKLTPAEFERTKEDLQWPEIEAARPSLVFRYSQPSESRREPSSFEKTGCFVARRFRSSFGILDCGPAFTKKNSGSVWPDMFNHLNGNEVATPFVSTSNSLAWTLHQAFLNSQTSGKDVSISLIAIDDSMTLYYAGQFHPELCKKYIFTNGAWNYKGTNEWLIYGSCKPFYTIKLSEIMTFASTRAAVGQTLRLDMLAKSTCYHTDILQEFKRKRPMFDRNLARTFAEIAIDLFGFTEKTPARVHQDLITSFCEGWSVIPTASKAADEWTTIAANFEHAFTRKCNEAVDVATKESLKAAFFAGIIFALPDRKAAHRMPRFVQLEKRATQVGLASPMQLLIGDLESAIEALDTQAVIHEQAIQRGKGQLLLAAGTAGGENDDEREEIQYEAYVDVENETMLG